MAREYPQIVVTERTDREATWLGLLTPYKKPYLIRIRFRIPCVPAAASLIEAQPRVQVMNPVLVPQPDAEDGPLPHVYLSPASPWFPYLCLFDPEAHEWGLSDLLAETTVPWTERWLLNYEFWRATGLWKGGGRHPTSDESVERTP